VGQLYFALIENASEGKAYGFEQTANLKVSVALIFYKNRVLK
jgi:hypothetical protein